MKLQDLSKHLKPQPIPKSQAEFDAGLDAAARSITGHGPGHPAYEAIVHPPKRGRRSKEATAPMEQVAVRLPVSVLERIRKKAKADRVHVSDELRMAITTYAAKG